MKESKDPQVSNIIDKIVILAIVVVCVSAVILFLIPKITGSNMIEDNDIKNWVSLVIEGGVAIFITVTVVFYSDYQQGKLKELVDGIHNMEKSQIDVENKLLKMINQQKEFQSKKKSTGEFYISMACQPLLLSAKKLLDTLISYNDKKITKNDLQEQLEKWEMRRVLSIEHLDMHFMSYSDVLNTETHQWVFELIDDLKGRGMGALLQFPTLTLIPPILISIDAISKSLDAHTLREFLIKNPEIESTIERLRKEGREMMKNFDSSDLEKMVEGFRKKIE